MDPEPKIYTHTLPSLNKGIYHPFAQVTVVDADEGDCNIVDFCHYDLDHDTKYEKSPWKRTIIDTGPPSKMILATLTYLSNRQTLPIKSGATTTVPKVDELQITHIDEDHIGNAAKLATSLVQTHKDEKWAGTIGVVFQTLPAAWPALVELEAHGKDMFCVKISPETRRVVYRPNPSPFKDWVRELNRLSFTVSMEMAPKTTSLPAGTWSVTNDTTLGPALLLDTTKDQLEKWIGKKKPARRPEIAWHIIIRSSDNNVVATKDGIFICHELKWPNPAEAANLDNLPKPASWKVDFKTAPITKLTSLGGSRPVLILDTYFSVKQMTTLTGVINDNRQVLTPIVPEQGRLVYIEEKTHRTNHSPGSQVIVSPNKVLQDKLLRYALHSNWRPSTSDKVKGLGHASELSNRASVVTAFYRKDLKIKMLFTGDAHDKDCDIRNTILGWTGEHSWAPPAFNVDILKVPHHGSELTTLSEFYSVVTAQVYLICGQHNTYHGNPKFSTLKAIVETFRNKKKPTEKPYYLFFSNPLADKDGEDGRKYPSAVRQLLKDPKLKPSNEYRYEMWKLRLGEEKERDKWRTFGTILFGRYTLGPLEVNFDHGSNDSQWIQMV